MNKTEFKILTGNIFQNVFSNSHKNIHFPYVYYGLAIFFRTHRRGTSYVSKSIYLVDPDVRVSMASFFLLYLTFSS